MSDEQHHELVIIKRHGDHEDGHHGGAWKIAFADFMTAMMALFLVLWLISSTAPKTKSDIAKYFNPVKLADMTPLRKGLKDPRDDMKSPSGEKDDKPSIEGPELDNKAAEAPQGKADIGGAARQPKHSEAALFRDPYAVLAEIASKGDETTKGSAGSAASAGNEEAGDGFEDPFATVPKPKPRSRSKPDPEKPAEMAANGPAAPGPATAPAAAAAEPAKTNGPSATAAASPGADAAAAAAQDLKANTAEAQKMQSEIAKALGDGAKTSAPHIEIQATGEGILISLTDEANYSMFAVGSAEPDAKTIQAMDKVAQLLKARPGTVVIRGHTDARPYRSATYDNWRLSSARAQMAHYMLVRGGIDEARIERIEGYADRRLKLPKDPFNAENRRIEILLRKDKP